MSSDSVPDSVVVSERGAARWVRGHPWIFRSDIIRGTGTAGVARVTDQRGRFLGSALYSPSSEIRLRLLERSDRPINLEWWKEKISSSAALRRGIDATAWRAVHAEADGLPGLVVDRYDRWLVVQILSAALVEFLDEILEALHRAFEPSGVLFRNDAPVRLREGLPMEVRLVSGTVPEDIEVREGSIRYLAAPWTGQKTGAFLDQRPARVLAGSLMPPGGSALDCFSYHGSFALHLAPRAGEVLALDSSVEALERGKRNAELNGFSNITWQPADVFESLRAWEGSGRRFDLIVLDPPAFAKSRQAVDGAVRGYGEINLRALRLLTQGGILLTASCSHHVDRPRFLAMLAQAAADSGRRVRLERFLVQGMDHPEVLTIPESSYLKGAVVRVI